MDWQTYRGWQKKLEEKEEEEDADEKIVNENRFKSNNIGVAHDRD